MCKVGTRVSTAFVSLAIQHPPIAQDYFQVGAITYRVGVSDSASAVFLKVKLISIPVVVVYSPQHDIGRVR